MFGVVRPDSFTSNTTAAGGGGGGGDENNIVVRIACDNDGKIVAKAATAEALDSATALIANLQRDNDSLRRDLNDAKTSRDALEVAHTAALAQVAKLSQSTALAEAKAADAAAANAKSDAATMAALQGTVMRERKRGDEMENLVRFLSVQLQVYVATVESDRDELKRKLAVATSSGGGSGTVTVVHADS